MQYVLQNHVMTFNLNQIVELVDTFTKNYNIRYDDVIKL